MSVKRLPGLARAGTGLVMAPRALLPTTPTRVLVKVMDSSRPGAEALLPVHALSARGRAWRGVKRLALVSGVGLVLTPVPLIHACGLVMLLVAGPVAGFFAWRARAVFGASEVTCPKCAQPLPVPEGLPAWPARLHCRACGSMAELSPATTESAMGPP